MLIDSCVMIPGSLPAVSTYSAAAAFCLAAGQQILSVNSLYMNEVIRVYLSTTAANLSLWIGPVPGKDPEWQDDNHDFHLAPLPTPLRRKRDQW